jgi:hypothetical protein
MRASLVRKRRSTKMSSRDNTFWRPHPACRAARSSRHASPVFAPCRHYFAAHLVRGDARVGVAHDARMFGQR